VETWRKEVRLRGRLVLLGFGSIGQGVLPLLLRHVELDPGQIVVVSPPVAGFDTAAEKYGVRTIAATLARGNLRQVLEPHLQPGDLLLNLSVGVSSLALIRLCQERGALYVDTSIEPWEGGYTDPSRTVAARTNYALREAALALRRPGRVQPTTLLTHGANPGLVSYFLKQALLDIAAETGDAESEPPAGREGWATLARQLGVKVIHVAERDTQVGSPRKQPGEFVNTWSVDGFVDEGRQPSELGWGTHERLFPADAARHEAGCRASIYLNRPGASTLVRTWTPLAGPIHGFLITHGESVSIADHLTLGDPIRPAYRPTVHYAYHPCDDAVLSLHEMFGRAAKMQEKHHILDENEIVDGIDELGVLLFGHDKNAYWYGSQLSIEETRALAPYQNATGLQVTSAVLGGMVWALENPKEGIVEADEMDFDRLLEIQLPYLGPVKGFYTDWTPLTDRPGLFPEDIDTSDPWQFKNILVR